MKKKFCSLYFPSSNNIFFSIFLFLSFTSFSQGVWTQKADIPVTIPREGSVGFSIGVKGYVCTGSNMDDVWEWNSQNDTWTQKANFPEGPTTSAVGFVIDSLGYILSINNLWVYSPATNLWTQKANFPGFGRSSASGFSIDSLGYVGLGFAGVNGYPLDFWQYSPVTNIWTQLSDFPGCVRFRALGINIRNKGYICFGEDTCTFGVFTNEVWEYDPVSDGWTQKANFPANPRSMATGFSIGDTGYIGTGYTGSVPLAAKDFWKYDPVVDIWTQMADFGGGNRYDAVGFSIGNFGYIATGHDGANGRWDLWEFAPPPAAVNEQNKFVEVNLFPNPFNKIASFKISSSGNHINNSVRLKIFNLEGQNMTDNFQLTQLSDRKNIIITIENLSASKGIYLFKVKTGNSKRQTGKFIIQ